MSGSSSYRLLVFDHSVEKFPLGSALGPRLTTQAYQGVSFASTINGTSRAKPSNTDCGKRYGCLGKRSMVIAGCDVVASTNRLISKNYHIL
jgi:hypothetical protein